MERIADEQISPISSQFISLPQTNDTLQDINEKFSPKLHTRTRNLPVPITIGRLQALEEEERERLHRYEAFRQGCRENGYGEERTELEVSHQYGIPLIMGQKAALVGSIQLDQANYTEAEDSLKQALQYFRQVGADSREAGVLNDLGSLYLGIGDPNVARDYLLQARKKAHDLGDIRREIDALLHLERLYDDYKLASSAGLNSLDLLTQAEALDNLWPAVESWQRQHAQQMTGTREDRQTDSVSISLSSYKRATDTIYNRLGKLHRDHGNYKRAEYYYTQAVASAERLRAETDPQLFAYRFIIRLCNLYDLYR